MITMGIRKCRKGEVIIVYFTNCVSKIIIISIIIVVVIVMKIVIN